MSDTKKARELRAKGTQGKWASDVDDGRPDDVILDAKGHRLAVVRASHHIDDESNFHNAKLIAYAVNALDPMADEIDRLRAGNERLRSVLFSVAEWCDTIAKYEPNKGGQQVGSPTPLQQMAGKLPSIRTEFRRWARDILEILTTETER